MDRHLSMVYGCVQLTMSSVLLRRVDAMKTYDIAQNNFFGAVNNIVLIKYFIV
jgi:hypothetical protein